MIRPLAQIQNECKHAYYDIYFGEGSRTVQCIICGKQEDRETVECEHNWEFSSKEYGFIEHICKKCNSLRLVNEMTGKEVVGQMECKHSWTKVLEVVKTHMRCNYCGVTTQDLIDKQLETVDEYNARKLKERKERKDKAKKTGVACPKCNEELLWDDVWLGMNRSDTKIARCKSCSITVSLET